jgi:hypothetical protein
VKRRILKQAVLLPDAQFGLGELLGRHSLPRFQISLQARFCLFDCFAETPLFLKFAFGGVFLAARRVRQPPVMGRPPGVGSVRRGILQLDERGGGDHRTKGATDHHLEHEV